MMTPPSPCPSADPNSENQAARPAPVIAAPAKPSMESLFPKHLLPYINAEIAAGVKDPTTILRNAVDKNNKLIQTVLYGNKRDLDGVPLKEAVFGAIAEATYHSIKAMHADDPPQYQQRWLDCAKEKGVRPEDLRPVDYLCWRPNAGATGASGATPKRGPA